MSVAIAHPGTEQAITHAIAERIGQYSLAALPAESLAVAKQCLLDWFAVTLGGAREPLTQMLLAEAEDAGGHPQASLVGHPAQVSTAQAALINGAGSHALDYDDVNAAMGGHPTVTVAPAVLALAEHLGANGVDVLTAFVAGYETVCRAGLLVGTGHYARGYHATATLGNLGAAAACARLLHLDVTQTQHALGIAATQAGGLKSMFGTMCKPLHAGKAAQNGLLAAKLAARGFTSCTDALEAPQGFADTLSDACHAEAALSEPDNGFHVRNNLFKYHAACYLTHASIDAIANLRSANQFGPADVEYVEIVVDDIADRVCNIPSPNTGLEVKFSLRHTGTLALASSDTSAMETYSDECARRDDLVALRERTTVRIAKIPYMCAEVTVKLKDGRTVSGSHNASIATDDVAAQGEKIDAKYLSLATPVLGTGTAQVLQTKVASIETLSDVKGLMALARA